jgi:hypothetical protein
MDHSLKQIEDELKEVKQNTVSIEALIHQLEAKLDKMTNQTKNYEGMSRPELEARMRKDRDETSEQTVIFHGVKEYDVDVITAGGEEQLQWDLVQCLVLLKEQNVGLSRADIKYCRRVGLRNVKRDRLLVVGFNNQSTWARLLGADYGVETVALRPDLTKRQSEERNILWKQKAGLESNNCTSQQKVETLNLEA